MASLRRFYPSNILTGGLGMDIALHSSVVTRIPELGILPPSTVSRRTAMRHLVLVLALLALSGCPDHVGGASPTLDSLSGPGKSELAYGADGEEYRYIWNLVKITDTTTKGCDPMGPGVEVDAVEVVRDGAVVGSALALAGVDHSANAPCADQPSPVGLDGEALGPADGVAPSLNGATLYLLMSVPLHDGDNLVIHELDPEGEAEEDCFRVYLGYRDDDDEMAFTDEFVHDWGPSDPNRGCETLEMLIEGLW
jgi:hypothetical protein